MTPMKLIPFVIGAFFWAPFAMAAPWTIDQNASAIEFAYSWSGAEAGGSFDSFSAEIDFDKNDLATSTVRVVIDMSSISAAYSQVPTELVKPEWFDVDQYPEAIFESASFIQADDGSYVASGTLTLRGQEHPSVLSFNFDSYGPIPDTPNALQATMKGQTTISRTLYGVGQGSWAATDTLADDVLVKVSIAATQSTAP